MANVEVRLGDQRVALKRFQASRRGSGAGVFAFALPVEWGVGGGLVVVVVLLLGARRGGHLVLVYRQPIRAATAVGSALSLFVPYVAVAGGIPLGSSPSYYWEIADPLGTGMVMLDEEGARVRHQTFSPFGRVHAEVGGSGLRTFYAGHRRDEGSGMFYMQARWYDPSSGTFLSVDPMFRSVAPRLRVASDTQIEVLGELLSESQGVWNRGADLGTKRKEGMDFAAGLSHLDTSSEPSGEDSILGEFGDGPSDKESPLGAPQEMVGISVSSLRVSDPENFMRSPNPRRPDGPDSPEGHVQNLWNWGKRIQFGPPSWTALDGAALAPLFSASPHPNSYALNNPINFTDPDGELIFQITAVVLLVTFTTMVVFAPSNPAISKPPGGPPRGIPGSGTPTAPLPPPPRLPIPILPR